MRIEQKQKELIELGTGPKLDYDRSKTFVDLFREQVARTPDAVAVVDADSSITYRTLDEQSDALAHWLIEEKGVKPNDFVAVMLPRRKEFVVSVLGIWKAGAAYVPIDPEYPEERKRFMIADCEAKVVIDEGVVYGRAGAPRTPSFACGSRGARTLPIRAKPSGLAYVIYTSGSTGLPKGAIVGHRAFANFTAWANGSLNQRAASRHLVYASFSFDISVIEMLCPLTVGGETHILSEEVRTDLTAVADYIHERKISGATFPTSVGMELLNDFDLSLEYAVLAGEKMYPVRKSKIKVFNDYGPCEFCAGSTVYEIRGGETEIPIGRPFPNCSAKICDADGQLIPRGQVGELYLSGAHLGMGYINRPELNKEKYVDGWYRTGDLCRWNDEGQLEYIGRIDNQVKIRGIRIELGEIEGSARQVEGIGQVAAAVKNDSIMLYWCGESSESDIRSCLGRNLPEYMLPSVYIHLDAMPLTPSGKIDRKALPKPAVAVGEHVPPATAKERLVLGKVREILGVDDVGVTDDLMRLGLNSIRAMKLAFGLPQEWGVRVSDVLGAGTIRGMLAEQHDVLWFHEKYDPSKRTVVVLHGVIWLDNLSALKEELAKTFNVLIIENIQDTLLSGMDIDVLVSPDGYDEFIRLYVRRMRELLPAGGEISLMIGFSFGGMMAYDTACAWKDLTGQVPVVVMGDSYLNTSTDAHDYTTPDAMYEKWREDLRGCRDHADTLCRFDFWTEFRLAIQGNKRSVPTYSGRVILLRALHGNRVGHNIGLRLKGSVWYRLALWIYVHLYIVDFLASKRLAHIGILESGHRREMSDNLSAWKRCKPDLEVHDVDTTHNDLFLDRDLVLQLVRKIRGQLVFARWREFRARPL